jgi:ribosomal protein S27AE
MTDLKRKLINRKQTISRRWANLSRRKKDLHNCKRRRRYGLKQGLIVKENCETCGKPSEISYHKNISESYDVRWFCAKCFKEFKIKMFLEENDPNNFKLELKEFENEIDTFDVFSGDFSPFLIGDFDD